MEIEAWQDEIRVILDKRADHTCEVQSIILAVFPTPYSLVLGLAKRPRYANGLRYANGPRVRVQTPDESTSPN